MCTKLLSAWQPLSGGPLKFALPNNGHLYTPIEVPCGQCMECRLEKSRQWAMRCTHEAQLHKDNCFLTLTYNDQNLPEWGSLKKSDLQRFFKRLRKHRGTFRYYACGEYGDRTQRAHYHACIFGLDFHDKTLFKQVGEHRLYTSKRLTEIWGHGNASIGALTFETAAYTARYVTKKLSKGQQRYVRIDSETGEIRPLIQPYAAMSLRPAIAMRWLHRYHADIYANGKDHLTMRGRKMRPAKYYDKIYDTLDPTEMAAIKSNRKKQQQENKPTIMQLHAREEITRARTKLKSTI